MDRIKDISERMAAAHPVVEANSLVNQIANLQAAEVALFNDLGQQVDKTRSERFQLEKSLKQLLMNNHDELGDVIVGLLRNAKVSTGSLVSGLVDEIEHVSGESVYPPPWSIRKSRWDIVDS